MVYVKEMNGMDKYYFTSEAVTAGHPDKICDYISDCILDEALKQDIYAKMAVEVTIKDEFILIYGEANTNATIDYVSIAKKCLKEIGYKEDYFVMVKVGQQSEEIYRAVEKDKLSAGDQGMMFGYACNETDVYMPAPIYYAQLLALQLACVQRHTSFLGPDGKTQVTIEYENNQVKRVDTIVISTQHTKEATLEMIKNLIMEDVIYEMIPSELLDENTKYFINPSGSFIVGGSFGDSGTTGRKIVCDSYGGMGRIGGGCFSSKDPTKVDRSGAYYCRYVAKNIVAHQLADRCEVQVAYAIGQEKPLSIFIDTFDTEKISKNEIMDIVLRNFDFSVSNIIDELDLRRPIYASTTNYGHFGRGDLPWEAIKKELR